MKGKRVPKMCHIGAHQEEEKKEEDRVLFIVGKNMFRPLRKTDVWKMETGIAAETDDGQTMQG
jgi:hypothetical protein